MKVTLVRHGGQTAGMRRQPRVVDTDSLPKPAARELARLAAPAGRAAGRGTRAPARPGTR